MAKLSYHHGNLRPELIRAGLRAVAEDGPEKLSLRDVARRAGVSAPAVYRHFEDKDDLLAAIATDCADRLITLVEAAVASAADTPIERFRATGIALVRFAVAHPEHFRVLALRGVADRAPPELFAKVDAWFADQRRVLAAAQAADKLTPIPVDDILLAAATQAYGLAHLIVEGRLGEVDDARAVELATKVTNVIGIGLLPRRQHKPPPPPKPPPPKKKRRSA